MAVRELGSRLEPLTIGDFARVYGMGRYVPSRGVREYMYAHPVPIRPSVRNEYLSESLFVLPSDEQQAGYVGPACGVCVRAARSLGGGCIPRRPGAIGGSANCDFGTNEAYNRRINSGVSATWRWPVDVPLMPADGKLVLDAFDCSEKHAWSRAAFMAPHKAYRVTTIPKADGSVRTLHVPCPALLQLQKSILAKTLNRCAWPEHVAAYVPGRTLLETAKKHAGKALVITLDLKNFFGSTTDRMVYDALVCTYGYAQLGARPYAEDDGVGETSAELRNRLLSTSALRTLDDTGGAHAAQTLTHIVTCPVDLDTPTSPRVLPQGAPTSGAFANLVAVHRLDPRVIRVAEEWGFEYSRYADDLIFSRDTELSDTQVDAFIDEITHAVCSAGYRVNWEKVRVQHTGIQQRVLGLVVNDGTPRVPRKMRMLLRAQNHYASKHGLVAAGARNVPAHFVRWGSSPEEVFARQHAGRAAYVRYIHAPNTRLIYGAAGRCV